MNGVGHDRVVVRLVLRLLSTNPEWLNVGVSVLTLLAVAAATIVAQRQWIEMKAAVVATRDQITAYRRAERARVGIAAVEGDFRTGRVFLPLENTGRVTSPNVTIKIQAFRVAITRIQTPEYHAARVFGGDGTEIPPGKSKFGVYVPVAEGDLSQVEAEKVANGQKHLIIVGIVDYDDGFGATQRSMTCVISDKSSPHNKWSLCTLGQSQSVPLSPVPGEKR
jgi:hypothetical protein